MGVDGLVGSNCPIMFMNGLAFRRLKSAHKSCPRNTAFAVSAEAKITGMFETYISFIGYTAELLQLYTLLKRAISTDLLVSIKSSCDAKTRCAAWQKVRK